MNYETIHNDDENQWQVWSPDFAGRNSICIGLGDTKDAALADCARSLRQLADEVSMERGTGVHIGIRYQHAGHWLAFYTALLSHHGNFYDAADHADDALAELLARIPQLAQPGDCAINPITNQHHD